MSTSAAPPSQAGDLERRLEFEPLIAELSSRFINLHPDDVDREIESALRRVCEPLGIDLAVLWQWSSGGVHGGIITPTHAYVGEGLQGPGPLREELFPWYVAEMLAGRIVAVSSMDALPEAAAVDREAGRRVGIKSNLCLPLMVGGEPPIGALGFNTLRVEREWSDELVQRLRLVAQIVTNALARGRHEQRLKKSERRLAGGAELAGLAFYEVDFGSGAIGVDDRVRDLLGVPADGDHGLRPLEFWMEQLHPDDREWVLRLRDQMHAGEQDQASLEYRFLHPTRGERWIHHLARIDKRSNGQSAVKAYGVLRDITESKRAADALRDLSQRLIQAHEEERALLARELHDDVTQRLAVLAIDVGRAEIAAGDDAQGEALRSVRAGLVRLSEDIHSLAYQLHPSVLEELGLVEALRAECERRVRQGRLDVSMNVVPITAAVGKDAALCLFRVAQEAMNNIVRHAGTRAARVTLRQMDDGLLLAVHDDGVGFDQAQPRKRRSLGLASMRERVQLVNGTLDIETAPGRGTTIIAWVPVARESQ